MYSYTVKVRDKVFLWGSRSVSEGFDFPLYLTVHNDLFGDEVRLVRIDASSEQDIAKLQPGECWTVPLTGLFGLYGYCETDSSMTCVVAGLR